MIKQTQAVRRLLPTNCLSVFDHFVGLSLKGLSELIPNFLLSLSTKIYYYEKYRMGLQVKNNSKSTRICGTPLHLSHDPLTLLNKTAPLEDETPSIVFVYSKGND